ncbi:hypothetical protein KHM83_19020 [Fusibacter paucivorans]|uniref:CAAX protease self-immunity n=1 Tax=Fusibacter paucivorans TaxID=76009 RepID=A0ABS5PUW6_9FIRM|nr:hypothetical protein [Fusibacter paucivorans]MBS7528762.1 hypothetical protein [Fusibacter paucivorans]
MECVNPKKNYLSASLWIFLALNLDIIVHIATTMLIGDDVIYRAAVSKTVTIILWSISVAIVIKYLKIKKPSITVNHEGILKISIKFLVTIILIAVVNYNVKSLGVIQIIHEYQYSMAHYNQLGFVTFMLQIIYYFLEASLITLIIITGSKWGLNKRYNHIMPYGGLILALTWGAVHFLTQGISVGLYGVFIALLIGLGYLHTDKNTVLTYIAALFIFLI